MNVMNTLNASNAVLGNLRRRAARPAIRRLLIATLAALIVVVPLGLMLKHSASDYAAEMAMLAEIQRAPTWLVAASQGIATIYAPLVMGPVMAVFVGALLWRSRNMQAAVCAALVAALPLAVTFAVKLIVRRNRPATPLGALAHDPSFPSGHVATAVALSALLLVIMRMRASACAACGTESSSRGRWAAKILIVVLVLLPLVVAASRLILGVHYPTDVLTSLVLGSLISASAYCLSAPEEFAEKATR